MRQSHATVQVGSSQAMRAAAATLVPPQFQKIVGLAAQPFLQPIYDLEAPNIAFGRVAILGDAVDRERALALQQPREPRDVAF